MRIPRVTIGLPVYNGEKYLAFAIESILAQSYRDFELIIADNSSIDNTQSICEKYSAQDKRIRYIRNPQNLGAAPNFNLTFGLAKSEYFKWAAYDDVIAIDYLARCVEVLDEHPNIVLCQTTVNVIDEHDAKGDTLRYEADVCAAQPHHRFRNIALIRSNTALPVFGVIRSDVLEKTGLIGSYPSSDVVLLAELSLYGQFIELDEPLFFWRVHDMQSFRGEYAVERDRVTWFNTAMADSISLPKWQYLLGYLRAISEAPLSSQQRAYCYFQLSRWMLVPDHLRALGKDVLLAAVHILGNRKGRLKKVGL